MMMVMRRVTMRLARRMATTSMPKTIVMMIVMKAPWPTAETLALTAGCKQLQDHAPLRTRASLLTATDDTEPPPQQQKQQQQQQHWWSLQPLALCRLRGKCSSTAPAAPAAATVRIQRSRPTARATALARVLTQMQTAGASVAWAARRAAAAVAAMR